MPDRARLAEVEQDEALRRAQRSPEAEGGAPVAGDVSSIRPMLAGLGAGQGTGRPGAGPIPRGVTPLTLMAMQRLAGNRATVAAIGRVQRQVAVAPALDDDEDRPLDQAPGGGEPATGPKLMDAAAGPPDGGAPPADGGQAGGATGGGAAGGPGGGAPPGGLGSPGTPPTANGKVGDLIGAKTGLVAGAAASAPAMIPGTNGKTGLPDAGKVGGLAGLTAGAAGPAAPGVVTAPRKTPPPPMAPRAGAATPSTTGGAASPASAGPASAGPAPTGSGGASPASPGTTAAGGPATGGPATGGPASGGPVPGGPTAPPPVAAPGPGGTPAPGPSATPTGPGGAPDPESAKTGIDWNQMLNDFGGPTRTVLEIGRLIPGWGLLAGLGADSINFAQDLAAIPNSQNADLATGLVIFRNFVNIGNNVVGHILYVDQLIQDGLAGSVVGAEFTPLTAAVNEALSSVKVGLDSVQMGTDIIIEVEALYESNHAPNSEEAEQWKALADGYAANILGDIVNLTMDTISLASAGASNTAVVEEAKLPLTLAGAFMKKATPNIIGAVNNVLGVWLGSLVTEARHAYVGSPEELRADAVAWDLAGGFVDLEGAQAKMTYSTINFVIDQFAEYADQQIAQIDAVVEALSGGKSTFEVIRDSVNQGLQDMTRKLDMVEQLSSMASDAQTNASSISAACDAILGALDSLVVPTVTLPEVELGDSTLANAAEYVANQARAAANEGIRRLIARVNTRVDNLKGEVRSPVEAVKEKADSIGEWLAILAQECQAMASTLNGYISKFSDGLAGCTNVEQVIDLIIGQVSDLTGMPRFTVQEIREGWQSVGGYIDRFVALGPQMHERAADLRAHADLLDSGAEVPAPTFAAPPEPPPGLPPGGTAGSPPAQPATAVA